LNSFPGRRKSGFGLLPDLMMGKMWWVWDSVESRGDVMWIFWIRFMRISNMVVVGGKEVRWKEHVRRDPTVHCER
jgi:hypothetical protein